MYARRAEFAAVPSPGNWAARIVDWEEEVYTTAEGRPGDPTSSLRSLEDKGHVRVNPPNATGARSRIKSYQLTRQGRRAADFLLENNGQTPSMIRRRPTYRDHPLFGHFCNAHKKAQEARLERTDITEAPVAPLLRMIEDLEKALGVEESEAPDTTTMTVVERAAAARLVHIRALAQMEMLGYFMESNETFSSELVERLATFTGLRSEYQDRLRRSADQVKIVVEAAERVHRKLALELSELQKNFLSKNLE